MYSERRRAVNKGRLLGGVAPTQHALADALSLHAAVLADRLSALRESPTEEVAREALGVFAPLANRLGVWSMKAELEDLAFKVGGVFCCMLPSWQLCRVHALVGSHTFVIACGGSVECLVKQHLHAEDLWRRRGLTCSCLHVIIADSLQVLLQEAFVGGIEESS
jgi:hypothetical protein